MFDKQNIVTISNDTTYPFSVWAADEPIDFEYLVADFVDEANDGSHEGTIADDVWSFLSEMSDLVTFASISFIIC